MSKPFGDLPWKQSHSAHRTLREVGTALYTLGGVQSSMRTIEAHLNSLIDSPHVSPDESKALREDLTAVTTSFRATQDALVRLRTHLV